MLNTNSSIGVIVAIVAFIVIGWAVIHLSPALGRILFVGSIASSLSQLFPIVQLVAGSWAITLAKRFGQAEGIDITADWLPDRILTASGGFIVAGFTGLVIFVFAMISGALITLLIPSLRFSPLPNATSGGG